MDQYLNGMSELTAEQRLLAISWGLHQVAKGLAFLINDCHLNHNNISGSVFATQTGSWKLAAFEHVTPAADGPAAVKLLPSLEKYSPPDGGARRTKW